MKSQLLRLCLVLPFAVLAGCGGKSAADKGSAKELASTEQRASYGIGYNIGQNLARQPGLKIDQGAFAAGVADALGGAKVRLDEKLIQAALTEVQQKAAAEAEAQAKANLQAANEFLAKNKARAGVKTTASGLQYEVLQKGFGQTKPKATDKVRVHYHGTLPDGTVFDSSVQRGQPAEFPLNGVIPGWTEALQLMAVGDKFKLYLPPSLAYGPRPAGKIPPNSALVFEVELIAIN
ncbi:MAG: peptidylprolyl isomerase [Opitutus sp.]|nr:peptidylprolyl isomerase [Opitutus sp.]